MEQVQQVRVLWVEKDQAKGRDKAPVKLRVVVEAEWAGKDLV
jgi:hypothetical protein